MKMTLANVKLTPCYTANYFITLEYVLYVWLYNAIIPSSASHLCGFPNLVKKRKDVKRPENSPKWHKGNYTEIPQVSLMGSASCLFVLPVFETEVAEHLHLQA